ncbi:hypothetical protein BDF20DRAFT_826725, partial [Mycotypha africana]|uniref:uncharacterized protein n=1 Tax=Mycotypha africana TaxID=64632 RepID=UPI002300D3D8
CSSLSLWLPMTFVERDRCLRWRLGWLPNNYSTSCLYHPTRTLTKAHIIDCLKKHNRLQLPHTISDPIFFFAEFVTHQSFKAAQNTVPRLDTSMAHSAANTI